MDPWLGLAALSVALLGAPILPDGDPGPSEACPGDMRLVHGDHSDELLQLCLDDRTEGKHDHCYRFHEGLSMLQGERAELRFCMDQYEAPNRRLAKPMVLQSYDSAENWCGKLGKRLCQEREWELACEGPEHRPWVYGWHVNTKLCNSGRGWKKVDFSAFGGPRSIARKETDRLWQGSVSGRYKTCVSPFGIFDLTGNVEEWVTSRPGRDHAGALMGGFWAKPWTGCRGTNDAHGTNFAFYETGFRCCKDATSSAATATVPDGG
jgi:Sulfatase-modifying factor enzyme 1